MACLYQSAPPLGGAQTDVLITKPSDDTLPDSPDDAHDAREAVRGSSYLSSKQAARYLGFTDRSLQNMRRRGTGPHFIRFGRQVRYHIRDLLAYGTAPTNPGKDRG